MKRHSIRATALLLALAILFGLAGCVEVPSPFENDDDASVSAATVVLISDGAKIYAPQVNQGPFGYDANVQPAALIRLDFNPGRDQYGNKTGLSASRFAIDTVTAQCDLKALPDTIFATDDNNEKVWFPAYTAPIEPISGMPLPYYPLPGYPWDSCRPDSVPGMGAQEATITATARAEWIEVEFRLPDRDVQYKIDIPGQTWTSESTIRIKLGAAGTYYVLCSEDCYYEVEVLVDWFFIEAQWIIQVGPEGVCG